MGPILVIGIGLVVLLWMMGWLTLVRLKIIGAATLALVGLRVLFMGKPLIAAVLFALAGLGIYANRKPRRSMPFDEACALLGVASNASEAEINAAYRRLMASAHPDRGGSKSLSQKLNVARDTVIGHLRSTSG